MGTIKVEAMTASVERAARCQKARGFGAEMEAARKHEAHLDTLAKGLVYLLIGAFIFGGMAVALYFGSI